MLARVALISVLAFICHSAAYAEKRHFEVIEWCFCKSINYKEREPVECLDDPSEAKGTESLFLWMKIAVNQNGTRYLRGLNKLPIYHAWGRNGWIEGSLLDIGINDKGWNANKSAINNEVYARSGWFDWRTFSEKAQYVYDGEHYVSVMDAERRPVALARDRYSAFRPSIKIYATGGSNGR